jgi:hypothetical protein
MNERAGEVIGLAAELGTPPTGGNADASSGFHGSASPTSSPSLSARPPEKRRRTGQEVSALPRHFPCLRCSVREPDFDAEAATGLGRDGDAMGVGDGLDDGETEPETVAGTRSLSTEAAERDEQLLDLVCRHDRTGVGDRHDRAAIAGNGRHLDPTGLRAVAVDVVQT